MIRVRLAHKLAILAGLLLLGLSSPQANAQVIQQDRIEAAMTLQILTFTEWPEPTSDDITTIGIFENETLFQEVRTLLANDRYKGKFAVRLLDFQSSDNSFAQLDAVFFSEPNPQEIARMIKRLEGSPIVLIASFDGFLKIDGMVNLTVRHKRPGFEINLKNAEERGIRFRAQLLSMATNIIK